MKQHKYTPEQIQFIKKNVRGRTYAELTILFNNCFGASITGASVKWIVFRYGLLEGKLKYNTHKYTPEQIKFLQKNIKDRSFADITKLFNDHFNLNFPEKSIKTACTYRRITNDRDTRFKPGCVSHNKGMKGFNIPGSEKSWFKNEDVPWNWQPVGSERTNNGYIEIKISDTLMPKYKRWRAKHIVMWEEVHGKVPKGHVVVFLDTDRMNITLNNLLMIPRDVHGIMCNKKLYTDNIEETKANILMCKIKSKIGKLKRKNGG
ncbi:MAG: HNH endonuclease [Treponema sp.]|nr:HNH endonuclease [Treponema sp.]